MYSRSYPNPGEGLIPPNYSGNAFDLARERRGSDYEAKGNNGGSRHDRMNEHRDRLDRNDRNDRCDRSDRCDSHESHPKQCDRGCEEKKGCGEREERAKRTNPFASLLCRRDGKKIECDDILLAGLIVLLLTGGADEELILILGFLFFAGL